MSKVSVVRSCVVLHGGARLDTRLEVPVIAIEGRERLGDVGHACRRGRRTKALRDRAAQEPFVERDVARERDAADACTGSSSIRTAAPPLAGAA